MEIVFMFIHYTVAGPSTEGVIMLLPVIAGGAGTYEMSIPVPPLQEAESYLYW